MAAGTDPAGAAPASRPQPLPLAARFFVGAVSVCGLFVVAHSTYVLLQSSVPWEWLLFAVLTMASGMLTLKVPSMETRFSVSEAFGFASVLLFGPHVGVLTFALDGIRISCYWKMNSQQTVFNFANLGLSIWAAGSLFFYASGIAPLFEGPAPASTILLYLAAMTVVYFSVNSGLTAIIVGLSSRRPISAVWAQHCWPLVPSYVAGGSVSLLLVLAFREVHFTAIALILPLLLICYLTLRSSFGRLEDSKLHVATLNRLLLSTVETLATAIDAKDEVTHDHIRRVQQGALGLARELGVTDGDAIKALEAAALLHDTGKIAVPEHILNKPGRLTPAEFETMKRHAPVGADILSTIDFPYPVVPIVRHHHENWDGSGYPDGLKQAEIPLGARILSVVDCFDALTSDRPYRRRMSEQDALQIIIERRGRMYDPVVVDTFLQCYSRVMPAPDGVRRPIAQAIDTAMSGEREDVRAAGPPLADGELTDGLRAVTSLSRAVSGGARVADVGALMWIVVRPILPCEAMAIFLPDEHADRVSVRFAAGTHAPALRSISRATGTGVAGWVAVNRRPMLNADPAVDFGPGGAALAPGLRSCLAMPLVEGATLIAVLALYRESAAAFSDDDLRLVELLSPRLSSSLVEAVSFERVPASSSSLKLVKTS